MIQFRNKLFLWAAAIAMFLTGCSNEPALEAYGEGVQISLMLNGVSAVSPKAASAASRAAAVDENAVKDLWVLQFQMTAGSATEGRLVSRSYLPTISDLTKIPYRPTVMGRDMVLYLVANSGDDALFSATRPGTTLAEVKTLVTGVSSSEATNFPSATSTALPMTGQSGALTLPETTMTAVVLTRVPAKVMLKIKNLLAAGYPQLTVQSVQLRNVPNTYPMRTIDATNGFDGSDILRRYPESLTACFKDYSVVTGNLAGAEITKTFYLSPNIRGISGNTDPCLKGPATAPAGQGAYCTYVDILATARAAESASPVNVRYRLYLGGNNTNDFLLQSNTVYNVNIELTGTSPQDARMTITTDRFSLAQGPSDGDHLDDAGDGWAAQALEVDQNGILTFKDQMVFFKFGSVVGFTNRIEDDTWSASRVVFNPTANEVYDDYSLIPYYGVDDFNAGYTNVSVDEYNTGANIKAGKGDPCRLVGLPAALIQSMSDAQLDAISSGWRLPTAFENGVFSGQITDVSFAGWTDWDSRYEKYYPSGSAGSYFPLGWESAKTNYLPAAGITDRVGTSNFIGTTGAYWASEAATEMDAMHFGFEKARVHPARSLYTTYGLGVRCVKDPVLEVDQNGILTAGGRMVFFQFGSVVGFTQENDWNESRVLFNPTTIPSAVYADYSQIPHYAEEDYYAGIRSVSADTYHTGANIKAGKGDPCQLAGLTATQIQSMTEAQLDSYSSGWRLPIAAENKAFTGQPNDQVYYNDHWIASDSRYEKWYYSSGSAGSYFPIGRESEKLNYLPAAGVRIEGSGRPTVSGVVGAYWSGQIYEGPLYFYMEFKEGVLTSLSAQQPTYGFGARCVKEPVLEVDQNGILTVGGRMAFFKFGGVVGFTQEGSWNEMCLLFNPSTMPNGGYMDYNQIQCYGAVDYQAGISNVSADTYHTGTNIKTGKGDPCQLVGLTAAQIRSMTTAELDNYSSGWRLPTIAENVAFSGQGFEGDVEYYDHWTASDSRYEKWYYSTGSAGGYFPAGRESRKLNYLPAAGIRDNSGYPAVSGLLGGYWSSELDGSARHVYFIFNETAISTHGIADPETGLGVRCVKD